VDTSSNPITITLPLISSLPSQKRMHIFADVSGNLSVNPLVVQTTSPNVVADSTSVTFVVDYTSATFASNTSNRWIIL
jgi:hypothetical protein